MESSQKQYKPSHYCWFKSDNIQKTHSNKQHHSCVDSVQKYIDGVQAFFMQLIGEPDCCDINGINEWENNIIVTILIALRKASIVTSEVTGKDLLANTTPISSCANCKSYIFLHNYQGKPWLSIRVKFNDIAVTDFAYAFNEFNQMGESYVQLAETFSNFLRTNGLYE